MSSARIFRALGALLLGCLPFVATAQSEGAPGSGPAGAPNPLSVPVTAAPLRIASLHTILTEMAEAVGGDQVRVTPIVRAGVDPHTFDPSPADLRAIVDADLVLAAGLNLEPYLERLADKAGARGRLLAVGDHLPLVLAVADEGADSPRPEGEKDPHWWHSLGNARFAVDLIRRELTSMRPESADLFARHARAYDARLAALQRWVAAQVATLPPGRRQLVTSHDAFGYFAHDYGFTVHALSGVSTESEPDARQLAALVDLIRREHIRAVFAESSVNPRLIANLVRETGVALGPPLYSDGLGAPGGEAGDYVSMYRHNVSAIVEALGGLPGAG